MHFQQGRLTCVKDICAVAVTYYPDAEVAARLELILKQVARLVIVDNGSSEAEIKLLREFAANSFITLIPNFDNFGVARALNIGIEHAISRGFKWVLLLDQDSRADEDMVQTLIAIHAAFPERDRLAVVGSGFRAIDSPPRLDKGGGCGWEEAKSVITSGSLMSIVAYATVGPFREEFFIDHVDAEYCFRARAKGYRVIKTRKLLMSHPIGAITRHRLLWFSKWTSNHTADRRYYFARNDTVLLREYGNYKSGLWALKSIGRCVRVCKRIVLYEQMKAPKMMAVAQGLWDGIRGRMGPRPRRR